MMRGVPALALTAAAACAGAPAAAETIPFLDGVYASARTCQARAAGKAGAGEAPTLHPGGIEAIEFNCSFLQVTPVPGRDNTAVATAYCEAPGEGYGALITVRQVNDEGAFEVTLGDELFAADEEGSLPWFVRCTGEAAVKGAQ